MDQKKEHQSNSPNFSQINGEDLNKLSDKKEFTLIEQKSIMENFNNHRILISNNMAINRSNENSEILKQMKDMSEVLLLINS